MLRDSFETFFEHSVDLLGTADYDGRFLDVNPAWTRVLGWTREEIRGIHFTELVDPEDRVQSEAAHASLQHTHELRSFTGRFRCKNGASRWLEFTAWLKDERVYFIARDVTENRQTSRALEEALAGESAQRELADRVQRHYESMLDCIPHLVWSTDAEGHTDYLNRRWEEFTGRTLAENLGWAWLECVVPEDRERAAAAWSGAVQTREIYQVEYRIRRRDGQPRWFLAMGVPNFDADGRLVRWNGTCTDIHERKEAEQRLRESDQRIISTLESISDAFFALDRDWRFTYLNGEAERLLRKSRAELLNETIWSKFPQAVGTRFEREYQIAMHENKTGEFDAFYAPLDRWFAVRAYPAPEGIAVYFQDVTDKRKLDEQLQQAAKLESISVLAGGVAHDFNNLLTGIMGNASMAEALLPAEHAARQMMAEVVRATERAAELTHQLLAYAGRARFLISTADLSELVRDVEGLTAAAVTRNIEVRLDLAPGLPGIQADSMQVRQVVMNLVINAAEAIGTANGGVISIRTGLEYLSGARLRTMNLTGDTEPGNFVLLEVADNGCGMPVDTLARIFDPFFTTKFTGRGLGLAASAGIVRGHRAALMVESAVGRGTTFRIYFPASRQTAPVLLTPEPVNPERLRGSGTVLIIDDEPAVLDASRRALQYFGYNVLEADDRMEGLRLARNSELVSVILLDLTMPGTRWTDALTLLHQARPTTPVILMSGYDEGEAAAHADGRAYAAFLKKPFSAEMLARKIRDVLQKD